MEYTTFGLAFSLPPLVIRGRAGEGGKRHVARCVSTEQMEEIYLTVEHATFGLAGFTSILRSLGITTKSMSSIGIAPRRT